MESLKKELTKRLVDEVKENKSNSVWEDISPSYDDCLSPEEREYIERTKVSTSIGSTLVITTAERGSRDDGIKATDINSVAQLLDTIEVFDDDDLEAVDIVNRHIDFGTVISTEYPTTICMLDGGDGDSPLGGPLQSSPQSFEEIVAEGESLLLKLEDDERLKILIEELEGIF